MRSQYRSIKKQYGPQMWEGMLLLCSVALCCVSSLFFIRPGSTLNSFLQYCWWRKIHCTRYFPTILFSPLLPFYLLTQNNYEQVSYLNFAWISNWVPNLRSCGCMEVKNVRTNMVNHNFLYFLIACTLTLSKKSHEGRRLGDAWPRDLDHTTPPLITFPINGNGSYYTYTHSNSFGQHHSPRKLRRLTIKDFV